MREDCRAGVKFFRIVLDSSDGEKNLGIFVMTLMVGASGCSRDVLGGYVEIRRSVEEAKDALALFGISVEKDGAFQEARRLVRDLSPLDSAKDISEKLSPPLLSELLRGRYYEASVACAHQLSTRIRGGSKELLNTLLLFFASYDKSYYEPAIRELLGRISGRAIACGPEDEIHLVTEGRCLPVEFIQPFSPSFFSYEDSSIHVIPRTIVKLEKLAQLVLTCEHLRVVPREISLLKNLKVLVLDGCKEIQYLPSTIAKVESLRKIELIDCYSLLGDERSLLNLLRERGISQRQLSSEFQAENVQKTAWKILIKDRRPFSFFSLSVRSLFWSLLRKKVRVVFSTRQQ